jgi:hypothetical protein
LTLTMQRRGCGKDFVRKIVYMAAAKRARKWFYTKNRTNEREELTRKAILYEKSYKSPCAARENGVFVRKIA